MVSDWARAESAAADFGDKRLNERYARILSSFGNRPHLSIPAGCSGHAEMQATYRFTDNEQVTFHKILESHRQCTLQRAAEHKIALFVQDTTEIDLTRPQQQVAGAGGLDGSSRRGLFVHLVHVFSADGTALGTSSAQIINRPEEPKSKGKTKAQQKQRLAQTPIEQKESMRWLDGIRSVREAAGQLPDTRCIGIADSDADIYELLAEPRETAAGGEIDFVLRACRERALEAEPGGDPEPTPASVRQAVMATPVLYTLELRIRGRVARTSLKPRGQRHQPRDSRVAKLEVRAAAAVRLRPPRRPDRNLPAASINVVIVREVGMPAGETPVEWVLLTTLPIDTLKQVKAVVEYYCLRWNIEVFFRTLKSGCRVEERRFEHVDRFERALGLYLIAAWRTMFVTRMGRECPDIDCEAVFEPSEWKAVWTATQRKRPPKKRPRLQQIVTLVAQLGGYVSRKDSKPGTQTVWLGLQRMYDLALAWDAFGPESKMKRS